MSREPVPVQSCWNGIGKTTLLASLPMAPFSLPHRSLTASTVAFDAKPFQSGPRPLRFRSIPDSLAEYHVEASECCLVHYDNDLSSAAAFGVWINPTVRVAYSTPAYRAVTELTWPTASESRYGPWRSRWTWWWWRDPGPGLKAAWRVWRWRRSHPNTPEPGLACVADLAMVLTEDAWRYRGARFE